MFIYKKIAFAIVISILVIEANTLVQSNGLGHFVMAFVYAGFIFAGAFFFISIMDKLAHPSKVNHGMGQKEMNSGKPKHDKAPYFIEAKMIR